MKNTRFGLGLAVALGLFPAAAHADQTLLFTTVDLVRRDAEIQERLIVTGIVSGEATPRTVSLHWTQYGSQSTVPMVESCERNATLVMSRPGRYRLEISAYSVETPPADTYLSHCALRRVP
jgi:hypothetical protein